MEAAKVVKKILLTILLLALLVGGITWWRWKHSPMAIAESIVPNCTMLWQAAEDHKRTNGKYPESWKDLKISPSVQNPLNPTVSWIIEQTVPTKEAALEFSKQAKPGQVIFCPIKSNGKVVNYLILAADENGQLLIGGGQKTMMFIHDHDEPSGN